ncbi:MAG: hypothetical protein M0P01_05250 [Treponema sp.]|nr:hypothetical protein [Treponema sp.]
MKKTILIAGKDLPSGGDFASGMAGTGNNVIVANSTETGNAPDAAGKIAVVTWNRPSSISARSVIIAAENLFGCIDESVLYFDAGLYTSQFTVFSPEECTRALDTMILGYEYLAMETVIRLEQRKKNGKLVFLLKRHLSMEESLHSSALHNNTASPAGPFVSAAQAAYAAFAENVAAFAGDRPNVTVLLISCDMNNETAAKDDTLSLWLSEYLGAIDNLKNKPGARQAVNWIKAGTRSSGFFSLFH